MAQKSLYPLQYSFSVFLFGLQSFSNLKEVQVKGPVYPKILLGNELVADILPPPEYVIESYLTLFQMLESITGREEVKQSLILRFEQLEKEYETRHEYWEKAFVSNRQEKISQELLDSSYFQAKEFYRIAHSQFLPAIQEGSSSLASTILTDSLGSKYLGHLY